MRAGDGTSGFTLIETLVALVIFVAGYVVVHQSVSLAWRGAQMAWVESAAVRLAQSRLAAAGVEAPLKEGQRSGETPDGFTWTIQTERYRPTGAEAFAGSAAGAVAGYWITVTVRWHGGVLRPSRSLALKTLKVAVRP